MDKPDVTIPADTTPPTELVIEDLTVGDGEEAAAGHNVDVHYVGVSWSTAQQFDASWDRGDTFGFRLGRGQVIQGWDDGVAGMKVGGRRRITIPPQHGLRRPGRRRGHRPQRDPGLRGRPPRRRLTRPARRRPAPGDCGQMTGWPPS